MTGKIEDLRRAYHRRICDEVLRQNKAGVPNNADSGSNASIRIGKGIIDRIGFPVEDGILAGQTVDHQFEEATKDFLRDAFGLLAHLRPGEWEFSLGCSFPSSSCSSPCPFSAAEFAGAALVKSVSIHSGRVPATLVGDWLLAVGRSMTKF